MRSIISATGLVKRYGDFGALTDVSLDVREREFLCIIGPSGCGKTTLLRILAGFVQPDAGEVTLNGKSLLGVPPYKRPINLVFQNYALFPHMNVAENVAFGLKIRKLDAEQQRRKVDEFLEKVDLKGFGERRVSQLSGGQQQRVALARALALDPLVLLLDEPLGALDQKVRRRMQEELKRVQREIGITFIHVTHDQEEALAMADRIAVMNQGRLEQIGPGREVYTRPSSPFVAEFVGESNKFHARVRNGGDVCELVLPHGDGVVSYRGACPTADHAIVFFRHEDTLVRKDEVPRAEASPARVFDIKFLGDNVRLSVQLPSGRLVLSVQRVREFDAHPLQVGDPVSIQGRDDRALIFPGAAGA